MQLTSSAFQEGQSVPKEYTGEGRDVSPPLSWTDVPPSAKSLALIVDDPDAPSPRQPAPDPWVHWVIFNIPAKTHELPPGIPRTARPQTPAGIRQGLNSWSRDNVGYRGPMPPPGSGQHRYIFKLYALDTTLDIDPQSASKSALLQAMQGHILTEAKLSGVYKRD